MRKVLTSKNQLGFTIIEIIVTVSVIGLLASIVVISYGNWSSKLALATVKNDLVSVASAMESYKTFKNTYPTSIPASFKPSNGITLTGGSSDGGKTYCITATSTKDASIRYYLTSYGGTNDLKSGSCGPTNITATSASSSSINLSWASVSGATSYTLQSSLSEGFSSPTNVTQSGVSYSANGLTSSTKYYYRVKALVGGVDTSWSSTASATTAVYVPPSVAQPSSNGMNVTTETEAYGVNMRITATMSPSITCATGTLQHSLRERVGTGAWSAYTSWGPTNSVDTGWVGTETYTTYYFEAMSRCYVDAGNISATVNSSANYTVGPANLD